MYPRAFDHAGIDRKKYAGRHRLVAKMSAASVYIIALIFALLSCTKDEVVYRLTPTPHSNVVVIGNTFAVGLQEHNYFETLLYKSFPDRNLTVRNLAWSADEVNLQVRPVNFGGLDEHLHQQKADIIIAAFGLNEAFKGPDSLSTFKEQLDDFLKGLKRRKYNGRTSPVIILLSPTAHEQLGGFLPDPRTHNQNLRQYSRVMKQVAAALDIAFVDLFNPTYERMLEGDSLTRNGIHLNEKGYKLVSEVMARSLGLPVSSWINDQHSSTLRNAIDTKNRHFFYRFKAANGEYLYGRRRTWAGGQALPSENEKIDRMVSRLDSIIWAGSKDANAIQMGKIEEIIANGREGNPARITNAQPLTEPDKSQFTLEEGYEIDLFASELDFPIANPVSFTFDPQGRLWVATMPSYPHYYPGSPPNDQIIVLEDTNHDGRADSHTVFADSLYLPLGFELGDGGVYVTQAPDFVFLKDTDGDGEADYRKTLLTGFGTEDSHHAISAYTWGPDGALYMHEGTFLHSQVETPHGPVRGANGITWRYEPLTMKLDPYVSFPYANPWGQVFTRDGTHLIADVSTGMNYFAPPITVAIDYPIKHKQMKDFLTLKVRPKTCGMEIVSSRHFPESAQGNVLFNTFIGFQGIKQHTMKKEGSGVIAHETTPLLQSTDRNFRPVDLKFGPDGALYVLDWYDPVIQHGEQDFRDVQRDHTRGRIWRVTYKHKEVLKPVDLTTLSLDALLDQLKEYEDRTRYRVRMRLRDFSREEVITAVKNWVSRLSALEGDPHFKLEALWVLQQFHHPDAALLDELLESPDANVRAAATRVLFYWRKDIPDVEAKLIVMSEDPSPRVRLEAIGRLSHFPSEASVRALLKTTDLSTDYYIDYALEESFKHLKPVWMEMFKKDKRFLADDPDKARRLLEPLASQETLNAEEYFVKDDPLWRAFSYRALSQKDYDALSGVVAVSGFRSDYEKNDAANLDQAEKSSSAPAKTNEIVIEVGALPGKMLFDKSTLTVPAGKSISLIFRNKDQMAHNIVIVKPGAEEKVGKAADEMASLEDGYERNFVPDLEEVLFATPLVEAGKTFQLDFIAPNKRGEYPFICSFPGHWRMMKGILKVE